MLFRSDVKPGSKVTITKSIGVHPGDYNGPDSFRIQPGTVATIAKVKRCREGSYVCYEYIVALDNGAKVTLTPFDFIPA